MNIYLGNLTISEIENRSGIKFPENLILFMEKRHQDNANKINKEKWHCFDIPFILVCGDLYTANIIYNFLKPYTKDFKEPLQIAIQE